MLQNLLRFVLVICLFFRPILAGAASLSVVDVPSFENVLAESKTEAHVIVDDVVAGFETRVRVTGLPSGSMSELHVISPSGEDTVIPIQADAEGMSEMFVPSRLTEEAGVYRAFVLKLQRKITSDATFEVLSGRIDARRSTISVNHALLPADGYAMTTVTVTLRDELGNPLPGRPVQLVGSRGEDFITPLRANKESDRDGRVQFSVQTRTPGEIALRAIDILSGAMLEQVGRIAAGNDLFSVGGFADGAEATIDGSWSDSGNTTASRYFGNQFRGQTVEIANAASPASGISRGAGERAYDVVDHFEIKVSTPTLKVRDVMPNFEIIAVDGKGKTVESYTGTVRIDTPGDPNATRPGLASDHGEATITPKARGHMSIPWSLSFSKAGEQMIVVKDETGTISGQTMVTVTGASDVAENRRIRLENLHDGDTVNSRDIILHGKGPALANLNVWTVDGSTPLEEITAGDPDAVGETDNNGAFLMSIVLPDVEEAVLEIMDQNERYDSGPIRLRIDANGPTLQLRFDPEQPREGENVTIIVTSEPGLSDVTFAMLDQTITLTDVGNYDDGTRYQALFTAPDRGNVEYTVRGRDSAGNVSETQGRLVTYGHSIPQVQNFSALPLAGGVQLSWDAIPDDTLTGYRIEAKSPEQPDAITLDTPEPTNGAAVMGLKAGNDYYFAVRALRGNEEGPRSALVTARTLGMEITVTPQEGSLLLQWKFHDATPLSAFVLEYGSDEAEYSEMRTLDGGMRVSTVKDLLAQPYMIRLTPVATNGEILRDLTVTANGTPLAASAFHSSADELIQARRAPDNALHAGAVQTSSSGLPGPSWHLVMGLTAIPVAGYLYRRRKRMCETRAFLRQMHMRYHS